MIRRSKGNPLLALSKKVIAVRKDKGNIIQRFSEKSLINVI